MRFLRPFFICVVILILHLLACERSGNNNKINQVARSKVLYDSIVQLKNSNANIRNRLNELTLDSVRANLEIDLAYHFYKLKDSTLFRYWNNQARSEKNVSNNLLGEAYWDLGNFLYEENKIDSAYYYYYKAFQLYESVENKYYAGRMKLNMAILQEHVKDYVGSEVSTIQALNAFSKEGKKKQVFIAYSNLGVVSNGLGNFSQAIEYHEKALSTAREISDSDLIATSFNNLGVVYERKKVYDSAIYYFKNGLQTKGILRSNPKVYAMLLDNLAYNLFKKNNSGNFIEQSKKALKIRESVNHISGQIINKIHLSEMYQAKGDFSNAIALLQQAKNQAKSIDNFDYLLETLKMLALLQPKLANQYFEEYSIINDSLLTEERMVRDKFARIRYETDNYIIENKTLAREKWYLVGVLLVTLILLILLYYQKDLKEKNRVLRYEKNQQAANEKIYELLLNERARLEEGRLKERKRIAEELHDGILGKLFGTRIRLGLLGTQLFKNLPETKKRYDLRVSEIQSIEKEIRDISHNLKLNLESDAQSFFQMLYDLIENVKEITVINFEYQIEDSIPWDSFNGYELIHLYRILQELLQNIIKHSNAENAFVLLKYDSGLIHLKVMDDGKGIKASNKQGLGFKNINDRINKLQGSWQIDSKNGAVIIIEIPVKEYGTNDESSYSR